MQSIYNRLHRWKWHTQKHTLNWRFEMRCVTIAGRCKIVLGKREPRQRPNEHECWYKFHSNVCPWKLMPNDSLSHDRRNWNQAKSLLPAPTTIKCAFKEENSEFAIGNKNKRKINEIKFKYNNIEILYRMCCSWSMHVDVCDSTRCYSRKHSVSLLSLLQIGRQWCKKERRRKS